MTTLSPIRVPGALRALVRVRHVLSHLPHHGHRPHNELWSFDRVEPILVNYDRLRYRLMPYIYSLAWKVTSEDYTIQRPLVMDWRTDPKTWNLGDQFMFGPAILVNPVLKADATSAVSTCRQPRRGTTSGPANRSLAAMKSKPMRLSIVCPSSYAQVHPPYGPQIEYATQDPAGPSSSASIAAPMANSTSMKMPATATSTKRASIRNPLRWDERSSFSQSARGKARIQE